jgi:hypothetical protein
MLSSEAQLQPSFAPNIFLAGLPADQAATARVGSSPDEQQWPSALLGCRSRQRRQQPAAPVEEMIKGPTNRSHRRNTLADLHPRVHRFLIRRAQIPALRLATAMTTLKRQPVGPPQKHVVMPNEKAPQRPHLNKSFRENQDFQFVPCLDRPRPQYTLAFVKRRATQGSGPSNRPL